MRWIKALDLEEWAARQDSRALLAALVADLIRASVPRRAFFRFPSGDKSQLRGFDGDLECDEPMEFVPGGKSKWEFGVSDGFKKAESDYLAKTQATPESIRRENTLVLVTPRSWDTPQKTLAAWLEQKKVEGRWQDVQYIDGPQLEHWLEDHPAVAAFYARQVLRLLPNHGARSTEEFWNDYCLRYDPTLTEAVVLADRDEEAKTLLPQLLGPARTVVMGAESEEDLAVFAISAIRSAPDEERFFLEARTLVVETADAAASFTGRSGLIFIAVGDAASRAGSLAAIGPTLVAATGVHRRRHPQLPRPTASAMADRMQTMGYPLDKAYSLATRCGRSLTVLQRLIPQGVARDAGWANEAQQLKAALMLGGWSTASALDVEVVKVLAGTEDYDAFEGTLRKSQLLTDPPIDNVDNIWQVRSPVDAFPYYGHLITDAELNRLKELAIRVFSHSPPRPSRDERFQPNYVAPEQYSDWLRRGLATTLTLIAAMHDIGGLQGSQHRWQEYVDEIVRAIPNLTRGHLVALANRDELGLLAEAAPDPFIQALEQAVAGPEAEIRLLFAESEDMFAEQSPHIGLLFAIEQLAWSPEYLLRLAMILAKLAQADPGGRYSNRPIETLRILLLPWSPQTYANLAQRVACLDEIIARFPDVGWQLLTKLLASDKFMTLTTKPMIRDFSPQEPEVLTYAVVWEASTVIAERAATSARGNPERLLILIKHLSQISAQDRACIRSVLEEHLSKTNAPQGDPVWYALREEVQRHAYFASAEWAMTGSELEAVQSLVDKYSPTDPVSISRHLFDDWSPHIGTYSGDADDAAVEEARIQAVRAVWQSEGAPGILNLAEQAKLPYLLVEPLVEAGLDEKDLLAILKCSLRHMPPQMQLAAPLSVSGLAKFGDTWQTSVLVLLRELATPADTMAQVISGWPPSRQLWELMPTMGSDVEQHYWQAVSRLPEGDDRIFALDKLISVGRGAYALQLSASKPDQLPTPTIIALLRATLAQPDLPGNLLGHLVSRTLKSLRSRPEAPAQDIAQLEFAFLGMLDGDREDLLLHKLILQNPEMFVRILSQVFRGEGEEPRVLQETERARAANCYTLLTSLSTVPGQVDEAVDADAVAEWVAEVRRLSAESGRTRIADVQIGQLLAHSPPTEAGGWPQYAIAGLIEKTASDELERGIQSGRINMRGVYSKGMHEGGDQERALADKYSTWANQAAPYPRVARLLRRIAASWLADAARSDTEAEKSKLLR